MGRVSAAGFDKRLDLLGSGREAGEVEVESADEGARVGGRGGLEAGFLLLGEEELVHAALGPLLVAHGGRRRFAEREEGPRCFRRSLLGWGLRLRCRADDRAQRDNRE